MDSDSEESFHSVQEGEAEIWSRMKDVDDELTIRKDSGIRNPGSKAASPDKSAAISAEKSIEIQKSTQKTSSNLNTTKREAPEPLIFPVRADDHQCVSEPEPEAEHPKRKTSFEVNPPDYSRDDLEDAVRSSPPDTSDPDTPSEKSTQSDKDSGSETREGWDKLNASDVELLLRKSPDTFHQEKIKTAVSDEWEGGWDEEDVTEDEINAIADARPSVNLPQKLPENLGQPETIKPPAETSQGYWGKIGGWGTSLFSTAIGKESGVASLTDQFGQAFSTVFETVEKTLGAPRPEEMAEITKSEEEKLSELEKEDFNQLNPPDHGDEQTSGWLAGLTSKVHTGSKMLMATGLDVMEGIGQKTMEVINDKDPGLRQTKAILTGKANLPKLSDVLQEAKTTKFETETTSPKNTEEKISFVQFFTEEQGSTSWEALEILSKQCAARLERLQENHSTPNLLRKSEKIDELCQLEDIEDDDSPSETDAAEDIRAAYRRLDIGISEPHKLLHLYSTAQDFLNANNKAPSRDINLWTQNIHRNGVRFLAGCSAKSLEQIRKISELIYLNVSNGTHNDAKLLKDVESVRIIVRLFCSNMDRLANEYASRVALVGTGDSSASGKSSVSALITDIFVESSNSSRYLQDALAALAPIFKLGLLEGMSASKSRRQSGRQ